jgi:hypothetical protein
MPVDAAGLEVAPAAVKRHVQVGIAAPGDVDHLVRCRPELRRLENEVRRLARADCSKHMAAAGADDLG